MALAVTGFRFLLGYVLLQAAVPKLRGRREFELAVSNYELLPRRVVRPVARTLPLIELCCGAALICGFAVAVAGLIASALFAIFGFAMALNLVRGRSFDCGCAGPALSRRISWPLVIRCLGLCGFSLSLTALSLTALPHPEALFAHPWRLQLTSDAGDTAAFALAAIVALALEVLGTESTRLASVAKLRLAPLDRANQ